MTPDRQTSIARILLLFFAVMGLSWLSSINFSEKISTNVADLIPTDERSPEISLLRSLADERQARVLLFALNAPDSSTANPDATRIDRLAELAMVPNDSLDEFFAATVEATEESIVNAMIAARDMKGVDDHFAQALPHERLREVLARYNRLTK